MSDLLRKRLVIFDVDGTLTPQRPSSTAPFERILLPGVGEKCGQLRRKGCLIALASNQGGIARGFPTSTVEEHLTWLSEVVGVAAYRYAWKPERKKPNAVMLEEIMDELSVNASESLMVGDAETDRIAAEAGGVEFIHAREF